MISKLIENSTFSFSFSFWLGNLVRVDFTATDTNLNHIYEVKCFVYTYFILFTIKGL